MGAGGPGDEEGEVAAAVAGRYLLDASALYPLVLRLRETLLAYTHLFAALDLTVYEVGNVIWKEHRRGRIRDLLVVARLFQEVLGGMQVISLRDRLPEIAELATSESLTFYDASYLYAARAHRMKLVTEDSDLQRFPESISVEQLLKELQGA
ncbi:type II toxin-antitoxin system VapC family toxin [Pyrodictium abyssi]|uniref:type II toxin-antitoxin system VapC family toxin n=1 Tax=Pyrodictium abyssi TaxID=54256 RepID=UPI0030C6DFA9